MILEANSEVLGRAELWAEEATCPGEESPASARHGPELLWHLRCPTIVLGGFWQDLVGSMADGSFGGILFDAYPLSPGEAAGDGEVGAFFVEAARLLRPGGIFTFYFDAGRNWIECVRSFRLETIPQAAGCRLHKSGARPSGLHTSTWMHLFLEGSLSRPDSYSLSTGSSPQVRLAACRSTQGGTVGSVWRSG